MSHLMLDLETFGTKPGCVLRSIGAAFFDPHTGQVGATFYRNIDRKSCEQAGLLVDPNTEKWWLQQSKEAQAALRVDAKPFMEVANDFHAFFKQGGGEFVWCQGANFDSVLWEAAVDRCWPSKRFVPWKFYNVRDTRTAYAMAGIDTSKIARAGTYHNALDDCLHQIKCVHAAYAAVAANMYE